MKILIFIFLLCSSFLFCQEVENNFNSDWENIIDKTKQLEDDINELTYYVEILEGNENKYAGLTLYESYDCCGELRIFDSTLKLYSMLLTNIKNENIADSTGEYKLKVHSVILDAKFTLLNRLELHWENIKDYLKRTNSTIVKDRLFDKINVINNIIRSVKKLEFTNIRLE